MNWIMILSALFLGAMLVFLFPYAKQAVKDSPKGTAQDWMGVVVPLLFVVGFVLFLMSTV